MTHPADAAALPQRASAYGTRLASISVLIVDDEPGMRHFIARILGPQCKRLELAASIAEAEDWLACAQFDVIVLDNILGAERGLDWLARQRGRGFLPPVVLISAFADLETAIEAMQAGAVDMLLKPFRSNQLLNAVARSAEHMRLENENHVLRHKLRSSAESSLTSDRLTGGSAAIEAIRAAIARVAPLPSSVLLTGASGTGKEVAARMIHDLSPRAQHHFVPVNCAAMSAEMVEAELFGHVEGAFAGATNRREGLFLHAQDGTLFLDEVSGLPLSTQAKLLRVIEDHRVRPVGAEREIPVDLRLIFATNTDLEAEVAAGRFRADLFYRINIVHLHMPPLRERGDDVVALAGSFMERLSRQLGMPALDITPRIEAALRRRDWPGNVRELRNLIERALILGTFPPDLTPPDLTGPDLSGPND
ncbi:sigma-54-dependent transcriptional regulator [Paenirhodobacter populi]|uniref:sigma-54-dependent transcriptional regulator n=1 Tax=Paenirhodobacter populi TaxID=2306993 RepID=UPI000FE3D4AF|nr:sigma-54 dependent transcriptional regulator [Sinirhodobacter populi]RWR05068.1 sigma-54-dependent Fis family transcriptional regulator [Sinirhodobacter populi]